MAAVPDGASDGEADGEEDDESDDEEDEEFYDTGFCFGGGRDKEGRETSSILRSPLLSFSSHGYVSFFFLFLQPALAHLWRRRTRSAASAMSLCSTTP